MLPEYTREELAAGLDRVAEEILEKAGIRTPPVDAFLLAQALGIAVALDDRQEGRARYVRLSGRRSAIPTGDDPLAARAAAGAAAVGRRPRNWRARGLSRLCPMGRRSAGSGAQRPRDGGQQPGGPAAVADGLVCGRRRGVRLGLDGAESALPHRQPRVDRAADVGMPAAGGHQHFRPPANLLSAEQPSRPGAAALDGRDGVLARGSPRQPSAADSHRPRPRSRLADPRRRVEAGDTADGSR